MTPQTCAMPDLSPDSLAKALEKGDLRAWYQPRVSCASGGLVGFEALARWAHPDLGLVMPDQFLPLAEEAGLTGRLTRQVIEDALAWFGKSLADTPLTIAVNLSSALLSDPQLPSWLAQGCSRYAVTPRQVILAMPETDAVANQVQIADVAMRLRIQGFLICISNFGVGYSSLRLLAQLPFSELAIDRRYVADALTSDTSREIITNVIGLSRAVDLRVTADGVSDQPTLDLLEKKGCHAAQGPLIAPPMEGAAALDWRRAYDRGRRSRGA